MAERCGKITEISLFVTTNGSMAREPPRGVNEIYSLQYSRWCLIAQHFELPLPHVNAPNNQLVPIE